MAGTERLKWTAMFVPIEEGFQRKSNHSQKQSRCQTKRSMSPGAENRSRCALLTLSVPLRPRRDAPSLLLSGFSMELEARIWFAAPQRRDLRAMKTRPCAPGKINALTSQNISPAPFRLSLRRGQSFKSTDWKKAANCRAESSQGRVVAAFWPLKFNSPMERGRL